MTSTKSYSDGMFCWNEMGTRDAAVAKKFYTDLFGWTANEVPMPGDQGGTYTLLQQHGKDIAGLYQMEGPMFEGVPAHWMVYMWADDVDASAEKVKKLGGGLPAAPFDVPGVGRIAICHDSMNAHFGLFHGGEHPGAAQTGPRHGAFCWRELQTKNTDEGGGFYTNLFPWKTKVSPGYTEFQLGGESIAGMMEISKDWGDVPSHWGLYVQVDDVDATVTKAKKLGAKVLVPPTDVPEVGRFSTLSDPSGAAISVIQLG